MYPNFRVIFILDHADHETYSICPTFASLPLRSRYFEELSLFVYRNLSKLSLFTIIIIVIIIIIIIVVVVVVVVVISIIRYLSLDVIRFVQICVKT